MEAGLTTTDRDALVAALLTAPVIEPGSSAQERLEAFSATLHELRRRGGADKMWNDVGVKGRP
jgi:hypothetical protein